jgi:peptide/nickel transport system substrate-binding protein
MRDYWGGAAALEEVEARFVEDPTVRAGMVRSGELDLVELVPAPQVPVLEEAGEIEVVRQDVPRTTSLYMNHEEGPTAERAVREAISLAIDREALAGQVMEGVGEPAAGVFGPGVPWAREEPAVPGQDVERARELLSEAGYEEGELQLSLWTYPDRAELPDLAAAIQGMLAEAGVAVEIKVSEYTALEPEVLEGNYDLFILSRGYLVENTDPASFLESDYSCGGSYNLNLYCSEEFDAILERLRNVSEPEERYELFREAEARLEEDVAGVPLVYGQEVSAHRDFVVGYRAHPLNQYLLNPELSLEE